MLQPVVRRTWAPRGQTPIHASWDRHDRLSAISALTVSPKRWHIGLYFRLQQWNFKTPDVVAFLTLLRAFLGARRLLVVLDRLNVHRSAAKELERRLGDRIAFEWLPAYSPELNPVEEVWSHTKHADLANFIPDDITDLRQEVIESISNKQGRQALLRSFFDHAKLSLD